MLVSGKKLFTAITTSFFDLVKFELNQVHRIGAGGGGEEEAGNMVTDTIRCFSVGFASVHSCPSNLKCIETGREFRFCVMFHPVLSI